ncbi:MAG: hypothetical protein KBB94_01880 [Legionellaceae bacterium]|nr:hypothetical protein [Legionellaceae bacterium]MBP9774840.1 hypothetical protein [Legionellaceae bacterium]
MLLAIRNFIQAHRVVSSEQLSREFRVAEDALSPMLEIWINKGEVRKANSKSCGSSCQSCHAKQINYYEWISRPH